MMLVVFIVQVKARVWMTGPELRSESQAMVLSMLPAMNTLNLS